MSLEEIFLQLTTEETPQGEATPVEAPQGQEATRMANTLRNIWAIAGKELRSYFVSPVAWVMMGLFALIFGVFFTAHLNVVRQQSMQSQFGGAAPTLNVNSDLIRPRARQRERPGPFILPMITMRTYAEEKRSGTIELLLTSPLTDFEIIIGKFLGALGLYCGAAGRDAACTSACCSATGNPEWRPLMSGTSGCCCSAAASSRSGCSSRARRRTRWWPAPRRSSCS